MLGPRQSLGARGRTLLTNAARSSTVVLHPCHPLPSHVSGLGNPSLGTSGTHDAEYPSGWPTLLPGAGGCPAVSGGTRGWSNPRSRVRSHRPRQTTGQRDDNIRDRSSVKLCPGKRDNWPSEILLAVVDVAVVLDVFGVAGVVLFDGTARLCFYARDWTASG